MVVVVPVPVEITTPGILVIVHTPVAGNPLSTTLPDATAHVGCVIVPIAGADGEAGCVLIATLADTDDVHPAALVTV